MNKKNCICVHYLQKTNASNSYSCVVSGITCNQKLSMEYLIIRTEAWKTPVFIPFFIIGITPIISLASTSIFMMT